MQVHGPRVLFWSALKKTRASGRNVGKVFNPVVKLVLENQPFLMPEPAEKPSLVPLRLRSRIKHEGHALALLSCSCGNVSL